MGRLEKFMFVWLVISLVFWFFFIIFIEFQSHLVAYYIWIPLVGGGIFLFRNKIKNILKKSKLSAFSKFMLVGIIMIILQSIIAALSNQAKIYQFLIHDFLIFIPWLLVLYFVFSRIEFSKREVYVIIGIQGLILETIFLFLNPFLMVFLPLTLYFYWVMIYPSLLVKELYFKGKKMKTWKKYAFALIVPLFITVIFQIISDTIRSFFPELFSVANQ